MERKRLYESWTVWGPWLTIVGMMITCMGLLCSCGSKRVAVRTAVVDSVAVSHRTVTRDSVVVRDSVRWVMRTAVRDSVVVRVDAATGEVVGRDSWHWRDTDNDKERFADVKKMVGKSDSLRYTGISKRDSVVTPPKRENGSKGRKSGFSWFLWGMGCGLLMSVMWKYRKRLIRILKVI